MFYSMIINSDYYILSMIIICELLSLKKLKFNFIINLTIFKKLPFMYHMKVRCAPPQTSVITTIISKQIFVESTSERAFTLVGSRLS